MQTLVNVCGASRSGSTMLDVMLGNGTGAFSTGEVYALFRPWRKHHRAPVCACGRTPCPVWEKIGNVPEKEFHRIVCETLEKSFVIDSSKDLIWLLDNQTWARKSGMRVFNLVLYKPPLELAYSQFKRGRDPLSWRDDFVAYHERLLDLGVPFVAVSYRALAETPGKTLEKLCNHIGMEYVEGQEKADRVQSHHLFGSFGLREQLRDGPLEIRDTASFDPAFENVKEEILDRISRDAKLAKLMRALKERDIANIPETISEDAFQRPLVWPVWYYARKLRNVVRRYFPQNFDAPDAQERAVRPR